MSIVPTLGPKVYKYDLLLAVLSPRATHPSCGFSRNLRDEAGVVLSKMPKGLGSAPKNAASGGWWRRMAAYGEHLKIE